MNFEQQIAFLQKENEVLSAELLRVQILLSEAMNNLKAALDKLDKNSSNSSKPPSSDMFRATSSLRVVSGKKVGGQKGHKGSFLKKSEHVDEVIVHEVKTCSCCGENLDNTVGDFLKSHQVFELPQIKIQIIEHQTQQKSCPNCKVVTQSVFPKQAIQPTQYGLDFKSFASYLSTYQLIPTFRCTKLLEDLTGQRISCATLLKFNQELSENLGSFIVKSKESIQDAAVAHFDETGYYFAGERNWLHTACTEYTSYYFAHQKRGKEAMVEMDILPNMKGLAMHDFWASYLDDSFGCGHLLCNVHHLRDLKFCYENEKSTWAKSMSDLLLDMRKMAEESLEKGFEQMPVLEQNTLLYRYDNLIDSGAVEHPLPKKIIGKKGKIKKSKSRNLLERFTEYKENIVAFVKNIALPFGNNLAEQSIRMMKVQQKISGCFRSKNGAKTFATVRSYIETMRKNNINILTAINLAFNNNPVLSWAE